MQKKKRKKKYFVKDEEGIFTVTEEYFQDIENRKEALLLVMYAYAEIQNILKDEALNGGPLYIGNMKITTGLQRSLDELDKRWPYIIHEMRLIGRKINGQPLAHC